MFQSSVAQHASAELLRALEGRLVFFYVGRVGLSSWVSRTARIGTPSPDWSSSGVVTCPADGSALASLDAPRAADGEEEFIPATPRAGGGVPRLSGGIILSIPSRSTRVARGVVLPRGVVR